MNFNGIFPQVIGEGDIQSSIDPEGSVQYYFIPKICWFNVHPINYVNDSFWNPNWVWLIRAVKNMNPIPASPYPQIQCPPPNLFYSTTSNFESTNPIKMKFHNDIWTSTTDLHYFFSSLRGCKLLPKPTASVQTLKPFTVCNCSPQPLLCSRQCSCTKDKPIMKNSFTSCSDSSESMENLTADGQPGKLNQNVDIAPKKGSFIKKQKSICECDVTPETSNKCLTTYSDKVCYCNTRNRRLKINPQRTDKNSFNLCL